jgi:hypothetical protein
VSAGVTHELRASCHYGDFVVESEYRPGAAINVHGPFHEDQRTIFYQTYRPPAGGGYEFEITIYCRR